MSGFQDIKVTCADNDKMRKLRDFDYEVHLFFRLLRRRSGFERLRLILTLTLDTTVLTT